MTKTERRHSPYFRFKGFLAENNISQNEIAELLGKSVSAVNQNLNGTGGNFAITELIKICRKYGISADYYFLGLDVPLSEQKGIC